MIDGHETEAETDLFYLAKEDVQLLIRKCDGQVDRWDIEAEHQVQTVLEAMAAWLDSFE